MGRQVNGQMANGRIINAIIVIIIFLLWTQEAAAGAEARQAWTNSKLCVQCACRFRAATGQLLFRNCSPGSWRKFASALPAKRREWRRKRGWLKWRSKNFSCRRKKCCHNCCPQLFWCVLGSCVFWRPRARPSADNLGVEATTKIFPCRRSKCCNNCCPQLCWRELGCLGLEAAVPKNSVSKPGEKLELFERSENRRSGCICGAAVGGAAAERRSAVQWKMADG